MLSVIDAENNLVDVIQKIESFEVFKQGNRELIDQKDNRFIFMKKKLLDLFSSSRLMPAFGVSLHNETMQEIESGVWLKVNFNKEIVKNGLPFASLLFKLEEVQGFNLIRLYKGKFDGRCLYLDLDQAYDLSSIIKTNN